MEFNIGMIFTGSEHCFTGKVEVLEVDEPNNILKVKLSATGNGKNGIINLNWDEDWNLQHVIWGFERGDYFIKQFDDSIEPIN